MKLGVAHVSCTHSVYPEDGLIESCDKCGKTYIYFKSTNTWRYIIAKEADEYLSEPAAERFSPEDGVE